MTLINTLDSGPLCPMSHGFDISSYAQAHQLKNKLLDKLYSALKPWRDEDDEYSLEEISNIYEQVNEEFSDYMLLYRAQSSSMYQGIQGVEAYWYQCLVCGYTLPAFKTKGG